MNICSFLLSTILFLQLCSAYTYDYTILVLPCGGATAIIPATVLEHIEKKANKPIHTLFDEIWSCSAGSIIASLVATKNSAHSIVEFFEKQFSSFKKAYYIRDAVKKLLGSTELNKTSLPLRILTAVSVDCTNKCWYPYDFSSDRNGTHKENQVVLADVVAASCTVYPYLYRTPWKIKTATQAIDGIDPASLCCTPAVGDPTAYFLQQFLPRLQKTDTLSIFFLGNSFVESIEYPEVYALLGNQYKSFRIHYYDDETNVISPSKAHIEIINIPVKTDCSTLINEYLKKIPVRAKIGVVVLQKLLTKIVGKENADANLLAMGAIPSSELKNEAYKIINNSPHLNELIKIVTEKNKVIA